MSSQAEQRSNIWATGMALFSMFFGAGNLIFPLLIGLKAGRETPYAILGLGFSAVFFPLLGLIAMIFYQGDLRAFLSRLGPRAAFVMLFVLYMTQGPCACLPRLVILMYGSIHSYFPALTLALFSILICAALFPLMIYRNRLIDLLGIILTPLFLITLAILVLAGMIQGSEGAPSNMGASHHFLEGLKGGYQTMDLIAALLFATIILPHLRRGTERLDPVAAQCKIRKKMIGVSLIAAALLMLAYIGLCFLASYHDGATLAALPPEEILYAIATHLLGPAGGLIAAATVFLACLTTALSLIAVFSNYVQNDLFRKKTGPILPLVCTLGVTVLMANLGFGGLMKVVGVIMQILYPALIVLCLINIAHSIYQIKPIKLPVYAALGLGVVGFCLA